MKQIIIGIFILITTGLSAQVKQGIDDIDKFQAVNDSTFTRPDSEKWDFSVDTMLVVSERGKIVRTPVYMGQLVKWSGGRRNVTKSTGLLTWSEFVQYGRNEVTQRRSELEIIKADEMRITAQIDQWRDFINEQRDARQ